MSADIVLEDDEVRIVDGSLKIEDGALLGSGRASFNDPNSNNRVGLDPMKGELHLQSNVGGSSRSARLSGNGGFMWSLRTVDLSANDADVKELTVGTGRPDEPNDDGMITVRNANGEDMLRLDGKTGTIQFGNAQTPMLNIFESGTSNPSRSVISHSPRFSNWGLQYRDQGDKMVFQAGGRPVLTANLGGKKVGIGTDSPSHTLDVKGTVAGTEPFKTTSDARMKRDVQTVDGALDAVQQLRGVRYEWDEDAMGDREYSDGSRYGFVAQELEAVLPDLVTEDDDGYKSIEEASLVPFLVEALKEQQTAIDEQAAALESMRAEMESLRARVDDIAPAA